MERESDVKVAIDVSSAARPNPVGIAHYLMQLTSQLGRLDRETSFYLCYRLSRIKRRKYFLRVPGPNFRTRIIQPPFTNRLLNRVDVFHGPDARLPAEGRCKKVVTFHDVFELVSDEWSDRHFRERKRDQYRGAADLADVIVAVSEHTKRDLVEHLGVAEDRVRVVHEGVDPLFHPASPEEIARVRAKYGLGERYLLYVGELSLRKNIVRLVHAFEKVVAGGSRPGLQLVLVGHLSHGRDVIAAALDASTARDSIVRTGHVAGEDLPALYSGSLAFLFPSLYEGFGLPVVEAMACGAPVVTSNISSLPEVSGGAALLVNPRDEEDIGAQIRRLVEDESLRESLSRRGLEEAHRFSWETMARRFLECYRELAGAGT